MKLKSIMLSLAAFPLLVACGTTTPYTAATETSYGFSEQQIETNRWKVTFAGNSLTDLKTVETYLLYRAAEITRNEGADYFIMVDRKVDEDTSFHSTGLTRSPYYHPFAFDYYHPRFGWRSTYDPFFDDVTLREITRYEATAEIVMGSGPKPADNVHAYNAEEVLMNLSTKIQRPDPN